MENELMTFIETGCVESDRDSVLVGRLTKGFRSAMPEKVRRVWPRWRVVSALRDAGFLVCKSVDGCERIAGLRLKANPRQTANSNTGIQAAGIEAADIQVADNQAADNQPAGLSTTG